MLETIFWSQERLAFVILAIGFPFVLDTLYHFVSLLNCLCAFCLKLKSIFTAQNFIIHILKLICFRVSVFVNPIIVS